MRKFIMIVVASLVPAGLWIAGCRQDNRQAAFPKTKEMKGLAKASSKKSGADAPPVIPPAPIDRDILNLPENATLARVNAVNDRSKQIAKPKTPDGLFTLPDNQDHFAMAAPAPEYQAAPAAIQPIPSAREFWSKPAAPIKRRTLEVPADIAAMAAPAPADTAISPPAAYMAPIPSSPAALPVENVPGIFMGGEPLSMRSGSPPAATTHFDGLPHKGDALGAAPLSSRRGGDAMRGREAFSGKSGPLKLDLGGLIGDEYSTRSMAVSPAIDRSIVVQSIPGDYEPLPEPIPLAEYQAILARERGFAQPAAEAVSFSAMPPLPSLDAPTPQSAVSIPLNRATDINPIAIMAAPALPHETPAKSATTASARRPGSGDVKLALAPLPDISGSAKPANTERKAAVLLPPPVTEALPSPELAAAGATLMRLDDMIDKDAKVESKDQDFFKTDFWEQKTGSAKSAFDLELPEPKPTTKAASKSAVRPAPKGPAKSAKATESARRPAEVLRKRPERKTVKSEAPAAITPGVPTWVDAMPEPAARETVSPVIEAVEMREPVVEKKKAEAPQKVKLQPMRRVRDSELGRIDSAADVPPLRF